MERPTILAEELDRLKVDRLDAVRELNKLGENIARQFVELKSGGGTSLNLNGLFTQQEHFSSEELIDNINLIVNTVESKIHADQALLELAEMPQVILIFKTLLYIPPIPATMEDTVRIVDSCLLDIANSPSIPLKTKSKFFELLGGIIDRNISKWLANQLYSKDSMPTSSVLPINVSYILDIPNALSRTERLEEIKAFIKSESTSILKELRTDPSEEILNRYGDYVIDTEAEEYEFQRRYEIGLSEYIESSIPAQIKEDATDELKEVLTSTEDTISLRTVRMAKIQLLRIYREYVNILLNGKNLTRLLIDEQSPSESLELETDLRVGGKDSPQREVKRRRVNRRVALFEAVHMRPVQSHEVNSFLDNNNYLPVSQKIIDFWLEGEKTRTESATIKLTEDQQRKLEVLKSIKESRLLQKYIVDGTTEVNGIPEGLPEKITQRALQMLGIGSPKEVADQQIEIADKKLPPDKNIKTYAVKVNPSGNVAVNHHYRLFILQETYDKTLKGLMTSIAHEVGHIFQQGAADSSILPGMHLLTSLGRAEISGEAGAIKVDAAMQSLFGASREVNTYHFDIVRLITEGKNYWEIFNEVFRILSERNIRNNEGLSKDDLIKITQRSVMRGYGNLASMSNPTNEGRYPTSTGFLSYNYQGIPGIVNQPFYVSGVPIHRNDLKEFMPQPHVNGEPVTEAIIVGKIIEAAYQVLVENNVIQEEA